MSRLFSAYKKILSKHPIIIQSIQCGSLMALGDLIAQRIEKNQKPEKKLNLSRTTDFFLIGTILVGPCSANWYKILHYFFPEKRKETALKKVFFDQIIFAPVFLGIFLFIYGLAHTRSLEQTKKMMEEKYLKILGANYKIWPMVQLFNFYFVPLNYQVLLVQTVALGWNTFVSFVANS